MDISLNKEFPIKFSKLYLVKFSRRSDQWFLCECINVKSKVTRIGRLQGHLTILQLQSVTQPDTMARSTMTGTVTSLGRSGTAAAMAQNEQTAEEHSTLSSHREGSITQHGASCGRYNQRGHLSTPKTHHDSLWSSLHRGPAQAS